MAPSIPSGNVANYMYFRTKPNLQETDDHEDFSPTMCNIYGPCYCVRSGHRGESLYIILYQGKCP